MKAENTTKIQFDSLSINEAYARSVVAAWPGTTPRCPSWQTSRPPCPKR